LNAPICRAVQDQIDYQHLIEQHEKWLREEPRTTWELLQRLELPMGFPWGIYLRRINAALWDAGYTSFPYDELNPYWNWCWYEENGVRALLSRTHISNHVDPIFIQNQDLLQPYRVPMHLLRTVTLNRFPWVKASGIAKTTVEKASYYLKTFDHIEAHVIGSPGTILLHIVCNLRMYYQQGSEETVRLMMRYFSRKAEIPWTEESIAEVWNLVECFTPSLSLTDNKTIAMRRLAYIEDDVIDLIAYTKDGGEVEIKILLDLFHEWNPDFRISPRELGVAVQAITGITSTSRNGKRYYVGFHIPSEEELLVPHDTKKLIA